VAALTPEKLPVSVAAYARSLSGLPPHNSVVDVIIGEFSYGRRSAEAFMAEYEHDPLPLLQAMIASA